MSVDSKTDNSGSEDTSDDENMDIKVNGYHDAENEADPETDVDLDRRHSGKLSESSGSAASDLYDYKVSSSTPLFLNGYACTQYLIYIVNTHRTILMDKHMQRFFLVFLNISLTNFSVLVQFSSDFLEIDLLLFHFQELSHWGKAMI